MSYRLSAAYASITAALFLGMAGCSSDGDGGPTPSGPTVVTATADLKGVADRWNDLSHSQRAFVCERARRVDRPDYRGMMAALTATGLEQEEAAAMLPYAVNQCL